MLSINGEYYNVSSWYLDKYNLIENCLEYIKESEKAIQCVHCCAGKKDFIWIPKSIITKYNMEGQNKLFKVE